jgi:heme A synthase
MLKGLMKRIIKGKTAADPGTGENPVSTVATEVGETVRAFAPKEQGTRLHQTDMLSDSKLSKAVRPVTIIWILTLFTAALVLNWFGIKTDEQFQELLFWALLCVLGFYFPGRDLVKTFARRK